MITILSKEEVTAHAEPEGEPWSWSAAVYAMMSDTYDLNLPTIPLMHAARRMLENLYRNGYVLGKVEP